MGDHGGVSARWLCLAAALLGACAGSGSAGENAAGAAGQSGGGAGAPQTPGLEVLHEEEDAPYAVALDDRYIYWVSGVSLRRAPIGGGAPVTLTTLDRVSMLVPAGEHLLAYSQSTAEQSGVVARVSRDGGEPDWLESVYNVQGLAASADSAFWLAWEEGSEGSLWRIQSDGSGLTRLATGLSSPRFLTLSGEQLYFASGDGLYRVSPAGGTPELVASTEAGTNPVSNEGSTYWLAGYPRATQVMALPPDGPQQGVAEMLMDSPPNGETLVADAEAIYWKVGARVLRMPFATRAVERIASGLDPSFGMAVAADGIYVAEYTRGRILRLAKDGSAYRPASSPITGPCPAPVGTEERALTPRAEPGLELLAFELEPDRLVASQGTYDRLVSDVGAVRALEPALAEVTYLQPHDGRRLQLQWTRAAAVAFEDGQYTAWDCLNEAYGLQDFSAHDLWVDLTLAGTYNLAMVSERYRQLPGVTAVADIFRSLDGPTICVSREGDRYEYVFDDTGGYCPESCWEHRAYHFASEAPGQVTQLAAWDSTTGAPIPAWFGAICEFQPRVEL